MMNCQGLAGESLQRLQHRGEETQVPFIPFSFIPFSSFSPHSESIFCHYLHFPIRWKHLPSVCVSVCVFLKSLVIKQHYVIPQEMLAEDKHWSPWYFLLILPHGSEYTHRHVHTLEKRVFTNMHTPFMMLHFMDLLMHSCGHKTAFAIQFQSIQHNGCTHKHTQVYTETEGHGFSLAP